MLTNLQVSRRRGAYKTFPDDIPLKGITTNCPRAAGSYHLANHGVVAMILKLTTNDKAGIWVTLSRILQMTLIDARDGYMRLPPTVHGGG